MVANRFRSGLKYIAGKVRRVRSPRKRDASHVAADKSTSIPKGTINKKLLQICNKDKAGAHDEEALRQHFFKILVMIKPEEFDDLAWSKKDANEKAPNVYKIADELTKLSWLVRHDILLAKDEKERIKAFEKYCGIMAHALKNNDIGIVNAIYSTMVSADISRLKLSEKSKRKADLTVILGLAEQATSSALNFKELREIEKNAAMRNEVIVPSITTLLNDLTFAHDGNLDENGNVKPSGKEMMGEIIQVFSQNQKLATNALDASVSSELAEKINNDAFIFDGATAYKRSLEITPRDGNPPKDPSEFVTLSEYVKERLNQNKKALVSNKEGLNVAVGKVHNTIEGFLPKIIDATITDAEIEKLQSAFIPSESVQGLTVSIATMQATIEAVEKYIAKNQGDPSIRELTALCDEMKSEITKAWEVIENSKAMRARLQAAQKSVIKADEAPKAATDVDSAIVVGNVVDTPAPTLQIDPSSNDDAVLTVASVKDVASEHDEEQVPEQDIDPDIILEAHAEQKQLELDFLKGDQDNDSAYKILTDLLKLYNKAVYESQYGKADKNEVSKAINRYREQIADILSRINVASSSSDPQLKAVATKLQVQIKPMVDKYNQLDNQLKKPAQTIPAATKNKKKSIKNVAKSLASRVKAIRHASAKEAVEDSPSTLELINRLRDETLKFNRHDAPSEQKVSPVAQPAAAVSAMPNDSNIGIEFEDDEISPAAISDRTEALVKAEPAVEQRSILIEDDAPFEVDDDDETLDDRKEAVPVVPVMPQQPAPNSPHMKAFTDFQRFQTILAADNLDDRNQIKVDAMKMGVRFMLSLPKENKPKNLSDIVKQAMVANPSSSLDITTKEAAKTILAAIISPNANLNDLTAQAGKIISRIDKLKETNPMTPQIKKKIALREDVHKYLRTLIEQKTLEMNDTVKAQVERAQPIIPTKQNIQSEKRAQAKKAASLEDPAVHLQQCIVAFKKLIDSADDTERAKFLKEGSNVPEQLKSMLIELERLNPQKVTADDVERLYIRGKKYWKEEGNQPLKDNLLIKLRDQLPRQKPGMRHSI